MAGRRAVEVHVLGDLSVTVGGRKVALPASKKTRALLGYLVVTGKAHLRTHLCDLLWQGPDDPRGALRWSLTKLRGVLGVGSLQADRERVCVDAGHAVCDASEVHGLLAGGVGDEPTDRLKEVAGWFRGELLEGLDLPDCYRYHEWCISQREAARLAHVEVLTELVGRVAAEPEAALRYGRERLAVDPTSEAAHVAVVRLLTQLGRNREAGEQVDTCRRLLERELGTKPTSALLAARVRVDGSVAYSSMPPSPSDTAAHDTIAAPLSGRKVEAGALAAAWRAALDGTGESIVLLSGEPGIGKSRLVDDLSRRVEAEGACVLRGRAFEAEMVRPYGPWIDALRPLATRGEASRFAEVLAAILPELGVSGATSLDRARVFDAVAGLLRAVSSDGGCLVVLDDLQWFDEVSVALLHFVARAILPARVLLACTARAAELAENASAIRLVRAIQRERRLTEISLGPLDPEATAEIARSVNPAADPARVAAESAGNPLFALELARAGHRAGPVTDSLDALLNDRLSRLNEQAQEVLPWAAALGRGFSPELLERVTQLGAHDLLGALDDLEGRGILRMHTSEAPHGYDFAHDLVRGAAYRRLSTPRRRFVHQHIARVLADLAGSDPALHGDVAHHAALAGDHALASHASVAAADRCLRMFANDEAARLAESGLVHADRLPRNDRVTTRMALLRVKVMSSRWLHRTRELESDLSCAVLEAREAGLDGVAAKGLHELSYLQREHGDLTGAHDSTLRAVDLSQAAGAPNHARQLVRTARCLALIERGMDQVGPMIDEASGLLDGHQQDFDWCWAHALERRYSGGPDAGSLLERALRLARRDEDRWGECEVLRELAQHELERGSPAHALVWCRELSPVAAKMGDGSERIVADALDALARVASCVSGADDHLERSLVRLREVDAKGMLAYVLSAAGDIDRAAGRVERAEARANEALLAAEAVQRRSLVVCVRALLADLALTRGDCESALLHLRAVEPDLARPLTLSARARARLEDVSTRLRTVAPSSD
jgi:DNA-binding SARP family transcriptional activator